MDSSLNELTRDCSNSTRSWMISEWSSLHSMVGLIEFYYHNDSLITKSKQ